MRKNPLNLYNIHARGKIKAKTGMNNLEKRYADYLRTLQLAVGWFYQISCSFRSMCFNLCSGIGQSDGRLLPIHPITNDDNEGLKDPMRCDSNLEYHGKNERPRRCRQTYTTLKME